MNLLGIAGKAGSGKSTVAKAIQDAFLWTPVAFGDPLKRICKDVYRFTDDQLWGPSESRNAPDKRYVRQRQGSLGSHLVGWTDDGKRIDAPSPVEDVYLTPRHALQQLGSEWGRGCFYNTWVQYALDVAEQLLVKPYPEAPCMGYDPKKGLFVQDEYPIIRCPGVVFPDVRFGNEIDGIKEKGGKVAIILGRDTSLESEGLKHDSERDLDPDEFDFVIRNTKDLDHLLEQAGVAMLRLFPEAVRIRR